MAENSFTVDLINQFVIDNFIPYAWCNDWEISDPNEFGLYFFRMVFRPNEYDRHAFNPSPYDTEIPLIHGSSITKNKKELESDRRLKYQYCCHLSKNVISELELMGSENPSKINTYKEVFGEDKQILPDGDKWSKLRAYENQDHRSEWSFL